ncbi:MAG: DUF1287 domain-containing protein, partial [Actinobacteria bacterium]|nr:DUF1287 domain-containing protein [Actinomycetota bacterium]
LKIMLIVILILIIVLAIAVSVSQFTFKKEYSPPTALQELLPRFRYIDMDNTGITTDMDSDGINDQKDILLGAKSQLLEPALNIFSEGSDEPNYYNGGDPPAGFALCTDIIARAYKAAGFNLMELVNRDISENYDQYPLQKIWAQRYPDANIDYRRIQNLEVFFSRNAQELILTFKPEESMNLKQWLPGDVVFFDMDKDGITDNMGIISDFTTRKGVPKMIYNYIDPGYTVENDILGLSVIKGHYRYPAGPISGDEDDFSKNEEQN